MASILAANDKTIVISKVPIRRNTVVGNLPHKHNLLILTPENIKGNGGRMPMPDCIAFIRELDRLLPRLGIVVIRGTAAARELRSDRQFHGRVYPYLTFFRACRYRHRGQAGHGQAGGRAGKAIG